ncbi:MAG: hypothetical protein KF900_14010 [Bacteroidetes bacterium]|nr:hypothetical protein [Bacteroidota bacterium]
MNLFYTNNRPKRSIKGFAGVLTNARTLFMALFYSANGSGGKQWRDDPNGGGAFWAEDGTPLIISAPTSINFGGHKSDTLPTTSRTVVITTENVPHGTLTVEVPVQDFEVSLEEEDWKGEVVLPYTGGTVYVRFNPQSSEPKEHNEDLKISSSIGNVNQTIVPLTAERLAEDFVLEAEPDTVDFNPYEYIDAPSDEIIKLTIKASGTVTSAVHLEVSDDSLFLLNDENSNETPVSFMDFSITDFTENDNEVEVYVLSVGGVGTNEAIINISSDNAASIQVDLTAIVVG